MEEIPDEYINLYDPQEDEDPDRFKATALVFIFCYLGSINVI